ncbi:MAG: DNA methyltransferase [Sulfitobacter sp.]
MKSTWFTIPGERFGLEDWQPDYSFPIHAVSEIIERWTSPGDWVLDPFFGEGTTGVVCTQNGRHCIGIEIDKDRATRAATCISKPSRLIVGDARNITPKIQQNIQLLLTSAPFFYEVDDDDEALSSYTNIISKVLERQNSLISNDTIIAIETVFMKRSGTTRNYPAALSNAMKNGFLEIDQTVFTCDARNQCMFGMDHFMIQQFKKRVF